MKKSRKLPVTGGVEESLSSIYLMPKNTCIEYLLNNHKVTLNKNNHKVTLNNQSL